jgi:hypothetical protein
MAAICFALLPRPSESATSWWVLAAHCIARAPRAIELSATETRTRAADILHQCNSKDREASLNARDDIPLSRLLTTGYFAENKPA